MLATLFSVSETLGRNHDIVITTDIPVMRFMITDLPVMIFMLYVYFKGEDNHFFLSRSTTFYRDSEIHCIFKKQLYPQNIYYTKKNGGVHHSSENT